MKLISRGNDGYKVISDNGREYDLLEGTTLGGNKSSDITFIFDYGNSDENQSPRLVDWCFGTTFTGNSDCEFLKKVISKYEEEVLKIEDHSNYTLIKEF